MTRLHDYYEHLIDPFTASQYPSFAEWLEKNGLSDSDDDAGVYGDKNPSWIGVTL